MGKPPKGRSSSVKKPPAPYGQPGSKPGPNYRRYFTSRKGSVFDAHDYGHLAWPIGGSDR